MTRIACLIYYLSKEKQVSYNKAAMLMGIHRDYARTKAMIEKYSIFKTTPNSVTIKINEDIIKVAEMIIVYQMQLAIKLGLKPKNVLPLFFIDYTVKELDTKIKNIEKLIE